jgi:hypothetical protein
VPTATEQRKIEAMWNEKYGSRFDIYAADKEFS